MKKLRLLLLVTLVMFIISACGENGSDEVDKSEQFLLVKGGSFKNKNSRYYGKDVIVSDFYLGKFEVTQESWEKIMGENPSTFKGKDLPVETVSWYDCIEYCNKRSEQEGLEPYYVLDKEKQDPENIGEYDKLKWLVTMNEGANGYRLPNVAEWEYAGSGGIKSKGYLYCGSDDINQVGWQWINAGDKKLSGHWNWPAVEGNNNKTHPIGELEANELGFYDMSGNVREWCWDWYAEDPQYPFSYRAWMGGGIIGGELACEISYIGPYSASDKGNDTGFRLCRSK